MSRLSSKSAFVTGAASGIGAATARLFAAEGCAVTLADVADVAPIVAEITAAGGRAIGLSLDVTQEDAWIATLARATSSFGGLDVMVNAAGIARTAPIAELKLEEFRRVLAVNLEGVFLGTKHAVIAMRAKGRGGSIVNVSSAMGIVGAPGASAYCASKGGVRLFTKAVALEVAGDDIRVNSIHPGAVKTPIWSTMPSWKKIVEKAGSEEGAYAILAGPTPQKRMAEPIEIAEAILYLASDASKFVTGSELVIDGGFTTM